MKRCFSFWILPALFLLLQPALVIAQVGDADSGTYSEEVKTGVKVEPVAYSAITLDQMIQQEEILRKQGKLRRAPAPAPWLPVPDNLPVPAGTAPAPEAAPEGGPGLFAPPEAPPAPMAPAMTLSFEALADNGTAIPPDTNGAVGPGHLMVPLNSQVRIQSKTGANISTVSLSAFWATLGAADVFDPKVIYDPDSGRFLFVSCAERRDPGSSMLLAVSATSDPTGTWYQWRLDGDANDINWVDYPNIGVNSKWITFTSNMYGVSDDVFGGVNVWVVDKASALDGGAITTTSFLATEVGGTHVPCLTYSASEPTQYLVNVWNSSLGKLRLYTITGTAGSPIWTMTSLFPTTSPWNWVFIDAPQLGSAERINTNDPRMMNAVLRNGSLWCTHAIALPATGTATRTAAKWWQINPVTGAVIQSGVVEDTISGMFYYFPSIAVNSNDEVLLGFSGSSATKYAGGYYTFREPATPANTMQPVSLLKDGEAPYYKTYGGTRNRWGDYSATCVDPVDDSTLWTIQEYAKSPADTWSTYWGMLERGPSEIPTISLSTASLKNSCVLGTNAPNQSFEIWNSGAGTLSYSISDDMYWLSCTPVGGNSTGEHDRINVSYSTSAMSLGNYSGKITISDPSSTNSPQYIQVDLKVANADLTKINLVAPWNGFSIYNPPTFTWLENGGTRNAFAVEIAFSPAGPFYSTYTNLRQPIFETSWAMPLNVWNWIPSGSVVYWRVRGVDLDKEPRTIITSDELWTFSKR